jgi:heme exporter protein CcmD
MNFAAEHISYVLLAYAISAVVLAGLAIFILRSDSVTRRALTAREKEKP